MRLQREDEIVRCLITPFAECGRGLTAIEGAVDLDRGELAARIFEFAPLRQIGRIKAFPPRLIRPTPDADADLSQARRSVAFLQMRFEIGKRHLSVRITRRADCLLVKLDDPLIAGTRGGVTRKGQPH